MQILKMLKDSALLWKQHKQTMNREMYAWNMNTTVLMAQGALNTVSNILDGE